MWRWSSGFESEIALKKGVMRLWAVSAAAADLERQVAELGDSFDEARCAQTDDKPMRFAKLDV